ncbi:antibiotic biosynthesis monooxygenase [Comamonas thiooxydans]|uniref:antibiotic biosynthesis monooxygenase family protein n=1 Tax=Comamonas thiooxydans TaxID=363952 RepID=UPI001E6297D5|nr:antibiotic biosynthesis monooxygenase family protein [Comamonas thiooxydans]BDB69822.1 antibiotic biosynthesis monooxygenase [Comamonas thiooxydans]
MIVEVADFKVDPAKHQEFGQALKQAAETVLSRATGYRGHSILSCIETQGRHVLTVQWETMGDHTIGFRQSAAFADWRAIIGPFFAQPPHVEHFAIVDSKSC